jgi:hypothetical protein
MQDGFKGDGYAAESGRLYKISQPTTTAPYYTYNC